MMTSGEGELPAAKDGEGMTPRFIQADATRLPLADKSVDLVFGSPPYMDARSYGIGAQRRCLDWVAWMLDATREAVRVSRGLVIWIVAGVTRKHCYWPGPEGLLYEWWRLGGRCWRPAYWHRDGIPGSGGKQWLRANVEYALVFTGCEKRIPWADNTANGHPPQWAPGGAMAHRLGDGTRVNQWGRLGSVSTNSRGEKPSTTRGTNRPSHTITTGRRVTRGKAVGDTIQSDSYHPPVLANPGCLIKGIKVGGNLMGHKLAHDNEAPFPQKLAEWFIRGWCPPGGIVLDPFSGSGTTCAAAIVLGRHGIGCDLRASQCELGARRCRDVQPEQLFKE